MALYTQSIREILEENKTPQQHLTDVGDVYQIARNCLFDTIPLGCIDNRYLEAFETGFALHFMNDEIGLETLPLWKIALNEKIYNNGSYINAIYENLDKQVFSNYKVHLVETSDTTQGTTEGTGSITNVRDEDTTTDVTDTTTNSETASGSMTNDLRGTGTVGHATTGRDTTAHTGTDTNTKTGSDTTTHIGTDINTKTGSDTTYHTGTDETTHTGTDIVEQTGSDENAHTGNQSTDSANGSTTQNTGTTGTDRNTIQVNSDTPMGSLQNLRTPGGNARGTGVTYAADQTYNYMSSAVEVDESNVQTDNTEQNVNGFDDSTTYFNDKQTHSRDLQDTTTYDNQTSRNVNLSDQSNYNNRDTRNINTSDQTNRNESDTRSLDTADSTTYGKNENETRNTRDYTQQSNSSEKASSSGTTGQTIVDGTVTDTQTRDTLDTTNSEHLGSVDDREYVLNWEMLYKSMPLLNKVWGIFDSLFMILL